MDSCVRALEGEPEPEGAPVGEGPNLTLAPPALPDIKPHTPLTGLRRTEHVGQDQHYARAPKLTRVEEPRIHHPPVEDQNAMNGSDEQALCNVVMIVITTVLLIAAIGFHFPWWAVMGLFSLWVSLCAGAFIEVGKGPS
jgi:hypothetical protein